MILMGFLDFSAAFDTVNPQILLHQIELKTNLNLV